MNKINSVNIHSLVLRPTGRLAAGKLLNSSFLSPMHRVSHEVYCPLGMVQDVG